MFYFCQSQTSKFHCASQVPIAALVVNGELLACKGAVLWVGGKLVPERGSRFEVPPAFCE
jgi:hypothetical protein